MTKSFQEALANPEEPLPTPEELLDKIDAINKQVESMQAARKASMTLFCPSPKYSASEPTTPKRDKRILRSPVMKLSCLVQELNQHSPTSTAQSDSPFTPPRNQSSSSKQRTIYSPSISK